MSIGTTTHPATVGPGRVSPQVRIVAVALAALLAVTALATVHGGPRLGAATFVGAFAGLALYHAAFGFTSGWRRFIRERRGAAMRAQLLSVAMTAIVSFPLIAYGAEFGLPTGAFVFPLGVATAAGAFMFGLGMQLGGGCGSGTLFTVGGGSTRMVITLAFFIAGGVLATAHWEFWWNLPKLPATSLIHSGLGASGALIVTLAALAALAYFVHAAEMDRHGSLEVTRRTASLLHGPWSLTLGAVALALVGILTFLVLGRPWGITSGLTLWGAKIADGAGLDIAAWPYWRGQAAALDRSVFADGTSVMNFGIVIGALAAAALAGRFAPSRRLSPRDILTAIAGGLLMGYGARLAFGCNIGGLVGGIVSGSVHGWGWLVFGFAGAVVGVRARRWIGMDPPLAAPAQASGPQG